MDEATLAITLSRMRIAIGVTALAFPQLAPPALAGRKAAGIEPYLSRMLGARDLALGLGAVIALDRGAPVRGWLEGAAVSDAVDAVATLLARRHLTPLAVKATVAFAGGAAVAGAYLSRRLDPAPPAHPHQPEAALTGHPEP